MVTGLAQEEVEEVVHGLEEDGLMGVHGLLDVVQGLEVVEGFTGVHGLLEVVHGLLEVGLTGVHGLLVVLDEQAVLVEREAVV